MTLTATRWILCAAGIQTIRFFVLFVTKTKPVLLFILFRARDQIMTMITMMMRLFWRKKSLIKYEKMKTGKYRIIKIGKIKK